VKDCRPGILISLIGFFLLSVNAESQTHCLWANTFLPNCTDTFEIYGKPAVDSAGNAYYGGYFYFRMRAGNDTLHCSDLVDAFLMKRDPQGNLLWTIGMGANGYTGSDCINTVMTDASGNVLVGGTLCGTLSVINGTPVNLPAGADMDIFFARFNPQGQLIWAKRFPNKSYEYVYHSTMDASGNMYYSCRSFCDTTFIENDTLINATHFVLKMDPGGHVLWTREVPGNANIRGPVISADRSGNLYLMNCLGSFTQYIQGQMLVNSGTHLELYLAKLNTQGQLQWAKTLPGSGSDYPSEICTYGDSVIKAIGEFAGAQIAFDNYTLSNNIPQSNKTFIFNFDQKGNLIWAKRYGKNSFTNCWDLIHDTEGNAYMVGTSASDTLRFDQHVVVNNNGSDVGLAFMAKIDKYGNTNWLKSSPANVTNIFMSIGMDRQKNLYTFGRVNNQDTLPAYVEVDTITLPYAWAGYRYFHTAKFAAEAITNTVSISALTELPAEGDFKIFPNPASDHLTVQALFKFRFSLLAADGREIMVSGLNKEDDINLSGLAPGMYLLKAECGEKIFTRKVCKQ
jgi:hypothetical protein